MGKRIAIASIAIVMLIFAWHLYLTGEARRVARESSAKASEGGFKATLSLNPITNVVHITLTLPPPEVDERSPWATLGSHLGTALASGLVKLIEPMPERKLNTKARENLDLYAMIVPYRVRITVREPDPATTTRLRARRDEQRKAEEERRREKVRSYLQHGLALENARVALGERFGQPVTGVFGTIVNRGERTLRKVRLRSYFLDAAGQRIGEKDFSPVLVTEFALGDNTPLRPGYRRDFGYSVKDDAPRGWAKKIEAEIVDIEFQEESS